MSWGGAQPRPKNSPGWVSEKWLTESFCVFCVCVAASVG